MPESKRWLDKLERYDKASRDWRDKAKKIVDRYRLERSRAQNSSQSSSSRLPTFNILWSNVQTLKPSLFSQTPQIIAERRHRDKDPIGRISSEVMQRASNEEIERNGFKDSMDAVVLDVLLAARGVPWVRFEADQLPDGGMTNERTVVDYIHWDDFSHSPERNWADVERRGWVSRRTALTKKEGRDRFGAKFSEVSMTMTSRTSETISQKERDGSKDRYGEVWEIWDAVSRKRIFVAKGLSDVLEETDDPFKLEKFFPCPRPAYGTLTNEDLFPIPDYLQYEDLAEELDTISWRIRKLTEALRLVGIYDASAEGLGRVLDPGQDGRMVPVSNFAALIGKSSQAGGGLNGVVQWLPMDHVIETLLGLYQAREQAKDILYEVSGISDIVRGQVDPREKATQSKIKANFASQRLDQRRRAVERTARDCARIQVEIMMELYSPATIREQSGFDFMSEIEGLDEFQREQVWNQISELLQTDKARGFRVDVETDSTVEMDAGQTQEARTEFLQSAGNFLNNILPVMLQEPELTPVVGEMLLFTLRGYRAGRTLENAFEEVVQSMNQKLEQQKQAEAQQQQQGPPPDPKAEAEAAKLQQQMQMEGQKGQAQLQVMQQKAQIEGQKGQAQIQQIQQQGQIEGAKGQLQLSQGQAELQALIQKLQIENEILQAKLDSAEAKIQ